MTLPQTLSLIALLICFAMFFVVVWYTKPKPPPVSPYLSTDAYLSFIDDFVLPVMVEDVIRDSRTSKEYYDKVSQVEQAIRLDIANNTMHSKYTYRLCSYVKEPDVQLSSLVDIAITIMMNEDRDLIMNKIKLQGLYPKYVKL